MYVYVCLLVYICEGQEAVLDSSGMELHTAASIKYRCWEQNPGPLQEWQVLLTTEPSITPAFSVIFCNYRVVFSCFGQFGIDSNYVLYITHIPRNKL